VPDYAVVMVQPNRVTSSGARVPPVAEPVRLGPRALVAMWDSVVVSASSEDYVVDGFSVQGKHLWRIEVSGPRRPVSRALRDAEIAAELGMLQSPLREPLINPGETERLIRAAAYADSLPAYSAVFVSPDRLLWIVDTFARGDSVWYATAFGPDGRMRGRLRGAVGAPVAFGVHQVAVRVEDADGVVTVQVYGIQVQ
jgi:hypothetical protein